METFHILAMLTYLLSYLGVRQTRLEKRVEGESVYTLNAVSKTLCPDPHPNITWPQTLFIPVFSDKKTLSYSLTSLQLSVVSIRGLIEYNKRYIRGDSPKLN